MPPGSVLPDLRSPCELLVWAAGASAWSCSEAFVWGRDASEDGRSFVGLEITGRQGDREARGRGLASVPTWTLVASHETLRVSLENFEPPSRPVRMIRTGTGVLAGCMVGRRARRSATRLGPGPPWLYRVTGGVARGCSRCSRLLALFEGARVARGCLPSSRKVSGWSSRSRSVCATRMETISRRRP